MHVSRLSNNLSLMGGIMADANESALQPPAARIEFNGEYTYTVFGMSISKPITFLGVRPVSTSGERGAH
jgi:hypothetical protein